MPSLESYARALAAIGLLGFALFAPVSIAGMQIGLGVALAGVLLGAATGIRLKRTPLDLGLLLFIGAALCSTILSREGPGAPATFTLWRHVLGFWIAWQALRISTDVNQLARRAIALAAVGLALSSLVGLLQFQTGVDVVHLLHLRGTARLVAAPGVPDHFAAMGFFISRLTFGHNAMIFVALFAGALLFAGLPRGLAIALVLTCALALTAIVLTFDRAAWLGLIAAGATLFVAMPTIGMPTNRRRRMVTFAAIACALICIGAALVPGVRARFASGFDLKQNYDRIFLWDRALEIIRDHPLAGIGFGNYPRVCQRYYDRVDAAFPMRTWAHNSILSLWAETGPLGLLALGFLLVQIIRALQRAARDGGAFTPGAMAAGLALFVTAQVHDVIYDSKVMYPLWFALALGLQPGLSRPSARPAGAATRNATVGE
jgi:O-antigen ligase